MAGEGEGLARPPGTGGSTQSATADQLQTLPESARCWPSDHRPPRVHRRFPGGAAPRRHRYRDRRFAELRDLVYVGVPRDAAGLWSPARGSPARREPGGPAVGLWLTADCSTLRHAPRSSPRRCSARPRGQGCPAAPTRWDRSRPVRCDPGLRCGRAVAAAGRTAAVAASPMAELAAAQQFTEASVVLAFDPRPRRTPRSRAGRVRGDGPHRVVTLPDGTRVRAGSRWSSSSTANSGTWCPAAGCVAAPRCPRAPAWMLRCSWSAVRPRHVGSPSAAHAWADRVRGGLRRACAVLPQPERVAARAGRGHVPVGRGDRGDLPRHRHDAPVDRLRANLAVMTGAVLAVTRWLRCQVGPHSPVRPQSPGLCCWHGRNRVCCVRLSWARSPSSPWSWGVPGSGWQR